MRRNHAALRAEACREPKLRIWAASRSICDGAQRDSAPRGRALRRWHFDVRQLARAVAARAATRVGGRHSTNGRRQTTDVALEFSELGRTMCRSARCAVARGPGLTGRCKSICHHCRSSSLSWRDAGPYHKRLCQIQCPDDSNRNRLNLSRWRHSDRGLGSRYEKSEGNRSLSADKGITCAARL